MASKVIIFVLCLVVFVCADVVPIAPLARTTILRSAELPLTSAYSSSVIQAVSNDGHGLSYSTVQTHNPVAPILETRFIQPLIRYNVGSYNLPLSNYGLYIQNPAILNGLSGLVPLQQIESDTSSISGGQSAPVLPIDSSNNSDDDSVAIEAN